MKLPWNQKDEIAELEQHKKELQEKISKLEGEKESFKQRFEAEKERRSKLSAQKQNAQKKINKLEQKIETLKQSEEEESKNSQQKVQKISLTKTRKILEKLGSLNSPEDDLLSIYSPSQASKLTDTQGLKSSISGGKYRFISEDNSFVAFLDEDFIQVKLKSRPFFNPNWQRQSSFDTSQLLHFIRDKKQWAAVSAGETIIFNEQNGEILDKEEITTRVDSKQKKGGFSQGRFERKRQEQIDEHIRMVEEKVDADTILVGEESLCKQLSGQYLGGFDCGKNSVDSLYNFRLVLK